MRRALLLGAALVLPLLASVPAQAGSGHDVTVTGTGVEVYPAYADDVTSYAIRTTDDTGDLTVTVTGTQPDATVEVDGRPVQDGQPATLSGLQPGDRFSVSIDDDCCPPSHQSWIYLPPGFPTITTTGSTTGDPVFVGLASFLSPTSYATVLDRRGVPLWLRQAKEPHDLRANAYGPAYSMFRPVKDGPDDTEYGYRLLELDRHFQVVGRRRLAPVPRLGVTPDDTDFHDVQFLPDGRVVMVGYHRDLRADGTPWLDAVIQVQRRDGTPLFTWTSKGHVRPSEARVLGAKGQDYAHLNSVELEPDGDLVASFRNTGQVLRIATTRHDGYRRGQVVWRLGGARNQFTFVGDPYGGFCAQHDARILPNGDLQVFDNGSRRDTSGPVAPQTADMCPDPAGGPDLVARPQTRVAEYALDTEAMTATLVASYEPAGRYTAFAGNAQRLASGDTFIGWANASQADGVAPFASQVSASGEEVWSATAQGWFSYRALTAPLALGPRWQPRVDVRRHVRVDRHRRIVVHVVNDGYLPDRFTITASRGRDPFDVRYVAGGVDITRAVTHDGWQGPQLQGGDEVRLSIVITRTGRGDAVPLVIRAQSRESSALSDSARVTLK